MIFRQDVSFILGFLLKSLLHSKENLSCKTRIFTFSKTKYQSSGIYFKHLFPYSKRNGILTFGSVSISFHLVLLPLLSLYLRSWSGSGQRLVIVFETYYYYSLRGHHGGCIRLTHRDLISNHVVMACLTTVLVTFFHDNI